MTTLCVIQARMGSTRLPGKVLADLGGRPMLAFMLARVAPLVGRGVEEVVVATSDGAIDEPVAEVARAAGVAAVRGSEHDVLGRYLLALEDHPADTVVRLTADCPLTDPALVSEVLALHRRAGADYTSNTLIRTFPDGLDVEVMAAAALRTAAAEARRPGRARARDPVPLPSARAVPPGRPAGRRCPSATSGGRSTRPPTSTTSAGQWTASTTRSAPPGPRSSWPSAPPPTRPTPSGCARSPATTSPPSPPTGPAPT